VVSSFVTSQLAGPRLVDFQSLLSDPDAPRHRGPGLDIGCGGDCAQGGQGN
jgi:hypothetical protein